MNYFGIVAALTLMFGTGAAVHAMDGKEGKKERDDKAVAHAPTINSRIDSFMQAIREHNLDKARKIALKAISKRTDPAVFFDRAVRENSADAVEMLYRIHGRLVITDAALEYAIQHGHEAVLEVCIRHGALTVRNWRHLLSVATSYGNATIVRMIFDELARRFAPLGVEMHAQQLPNGADGRPVIRVDLRMGGELLDEISRDDGLGHRVSGGPDREHATWAPRMSLGAVHDPSQIAPRPAVGLEQNVVHMGLWQDPITRVHLMMIVICMVYLTIRSVM